MNSLIAGTPPENLLSQIAAFPERVQNKILDLYYPLTEPLLRAQNRAKRSGLGNLITNVGYVFNALRLENPFGDRPIEFSVREFALKWEIPLSSCYAALAQLRHLGIIKRIGGLSRIDWIANPVPSQSQSKLETPLSPNLPPPERPATPTEGEPPPPPPSSAAESVPAPTKAKQSKLRSQPEFPAPLHLSREVIVQLKEVKVDLSRKDVLNILERASSSQIADTLDHMRQHWELIETKYSHGHTTIFIKELDKRIDGRAGDGSPKSPARNHSQEFADWYARAISDGIVIDRPAKYLPTSSSHEPIVTLANGEQSLWTLVRQYDSKNNSTRAAGQSPEESKVSFRETLAKVNPALLHKLTPKNNTE